MQIDVFGKIWTLICNKHGKVTISSNKQMIPRHADILPQTVYLQTMMKAKLLTGVSLSIFQKSGAHFWHNV
jgi:hypothetical protein